MDAVAARNVSKTFGGRRPVAALSDVSLTIREGEIYGLLGPNGAGKTTLIAILIGLTAPDRGTVEICGLDLRRHLHEVQQRVNLVRGFSGVLEKFTTWELLRYYALLYGVPKARIGEVMARAGVASRRDGQVGLFSSGWRQRFFLAKGTINRPQVLFMDEPTVGLDVDAATAVREIIADLNREGCTILLTTHYMREAEALCGRIGMISQGRIVAEGTTAELKQQVKEEEAILVRGRLEPRLKQRLEAAPGVLGLVPGEDAWRLRVRDRGAMLPVLQALVDGGAQVDSVRFDQPSLEEVFLKLTHQGLEQGDE